MASKRPNVIIVITDDQGYGDLGCHGNPAAMTPNLDQLHRESVRLTDFHAAPMCTPTRSQLFTGLDACRNGAVNVSSGRTMMRADLPTMADMFRASGYRTGLFGKWHLGDNYPFRPQDRGFEETLWFPSSHIGSVPDYWENDYFDDVYSRNGERREHDGYCTDVFFGAAMDWMADRVKADERFLCYLPTNAPHAPWYVPAEDREAVAARFEQVVDQFPGLSDRHRQEIVRFLAMIRVIDRQVGALRSFLEAQAIARDTILIFMTDNGSTFGPVYYNAGMRGGKCTLWEGGHRVPCFVHWPAGESGALGEPRDIAGLTQVQDILPTLIDWCDLERLDGPAFDGMSLVPVFAGEQDVPADRMIAVNYSRMPGEMDYPSPASKAVVRREGAAVMWKRWRLLEATGLYDLDADPMQQTNVIEKHPDVARKMTAYLDRWWAEVEPVANSVQRVIIGHDAENPMMLSACEWRDVFVDQQKQVRIGQRRNSYWHLTVDRPGTYTFELRRWPRESGLKLRDPCPEAELTDATLDEGVVLPIAGARMLIGEQRRQCDLGDDADCATFAVDLEAGDTLLHTWFDSESNPICGAYYVYVERK